MKSLAAIIGGYLIFGVSSVLLFQIAGRHPHAPASLPFMIGGTLYGIGFALLAGMVAAFFAPRRPLMHSGIVAVIIASAAAASLFAPGEKWTQWGALCLMAPSVLLGGLLGSRLRK